MVNQIISRNSISEQWIFFSRGGFHVTSECALNKKFLCIYSDVCWWTERQEPVTLPCPLFACSQLPERDSGEHAICSKFKHIRFREFRVHVLTNQSMQFIVFTKAAHKIESSFELIDYVWKPAYFVRSLFHTLPRKRLARCRKLKNVWLIDCFTRNKKKCQLNCTQNALSATQTGMHAYLNVCTCLIVHWSALLSSWTDTFTTAAAAAAARANKLTRSSTFISFDTSEWCLLVVEYSSAWCDSINNIIIKTNTHFSATFICVPA